MSGSCKPISPIVDVLKGRKIIDLTVTMSPNLPCYCAGGQPFIMSLFNWFEGPQSRAFYYDNVLIMEEHTGTHCDAPAHLIPKPETGLPHAAEIGNMTVEKVPVSQMMGPADVIDVRHLVGTEPPGVSPVIKRELVQQWESKHGEIEAGDVVLFYTGWTDMYYKPFPEGFKLDRDCRFWTPLWGQKRGPGWPAPDADAMEYVVNKGVRHIGFDTVSSGLIQEDNEPHWAALEKGVVLTEKLIGLGQLPPRGAFYVFLPIKVEGGTGAPGRAIAIV